MVTHAGLFREFPTAGFPEPRCGGVLGLVWQRSDPCLGAHAPTEHTVIKFTCALCGTHLVLDATDGQVLNAYLPPPATSAARDLAGATEG